METLVYQRNQLCVWPCACDQIVQPLFGECMNACMHPHLTYTHTHILHKACMHTYTTHAYTLTWSHVLLLLLWLFSGQGFPQCNHIKDLLRENGQCNPLLWMDSWELSNLANCKIRAVKTCNIKRLQRLLTPRACIIMKHTLWQTTIRHTLLLQTQAQL